MYGYVVPVKDKMSTADFALYRAFYCGICKATGRAYGQMPRFTTNYDIVFLSVLLFEATKREVQFENKGCVLNPFKKKTTVCGDELLDKIAAANIILSYYKAEDGVQDREGAKYGAVKRLLQKPYEKACRLLPEADAAVKSGYEALRALEKQNCDGVDRVSHCFATILSRLAEILHPEADEYVLRLCYNVGKFVYLADALDDAADDKKKGRYNPFLAGGQPFENRRQFIEDNKKELEFALASTVNRAIECFNHLTCTQSYDLLRNIVYYGLRDKTQEIFDSCKKLKPPKI